MASRIMRRKIVGAGLLWLLVACGNGGAGSAGKAASAETAPARDSNQSAVAAAVAADPRPVILFFGTSLTAGLGLEPEEAYPTLIQQKLDSAGLPFRAVNAG